MNSKPNLHARAIKHLARREYSRFELEKKLVEHAQTPEALTEVLDALEQQGFLSAERLVEQVVHSRRNRYGSQRIRQELKEKGVAGHLIDAAMIDLSETELVVARKIWQTKFGAVAENLKERSKQARFLAGRGFSSEIIRQVLAGSDDDI